MQRPGSREKDLRFQRRMWPGRERRKRNEHGGAARTDNAMHGGTRRVPAMDELVKGLVPTWPSLVSRHVSHATRGRQVFFDNHHFAFSQSCSSQRLSACSSSPARCGSAGYQRCPTPSSCVPAISAYLLYSYIVHMRTARLACGQPPSPLHGIWAETLCSRLLSFPVNANASLPRRPNLISKDAENRDLRAMITRTT